MAWPDPAKYETKIDPKADLDKSANSGRIAISSPKAAEKEPEAS